MMIDIFFTLDEIYDYWQFDILLTQDVVLLYYTFFKYFFFLIFFLWFVCTYCQVLWSTDL